MNAYKASTRTSHLCIRIMDIYSTKVKKLLLLDLYHIAVTSIFLSFKYEEVKPISLKSICEKVSQGLMSREQLLLYEKKILKALNYNLFVPTVCDFCEVLLKKCENFDDSYKIFLYDICAISLQLASKSVSKLAEAIFLILTKGKIPTQGPLALIIQEISFVRESFVPACFPTIFSKHNKFFN